MKPELRCAALLAGLIGLVGSPAMAATISLKEWALNIDGTAYGDYFDPAPSNMNDAAFDFTTGLGTLSARITGAGSHFVGWFLDLDIEDSGNSWYNETGSTVGSPAAGQSWEIDEPGYGIDDGTAGVGSYVGDVVYFNFLDSDASGSFLDNLVFESIARCDPTGGGDAGFCDDPADYYDDTQRLPLTDFKSSGEDDVSAAIGWNFLLAPDQWATVSITATQTMPSSGFYLVQSDPLSAMQIYVTGNLAIRQVPAPATLPLLLGGLGGIHLLGRRRRLRVDRGAAT